MLWPSSSKFRCEIKHCSNGSKQWSKAVRLNWWKPRGCCTTWLLSEPIWCLALNLFAVRKHRWAGAADYSSALLTSWYFPAWLLLIKQAYVIPCLQYLTLFTSGTVTLLTHSRTDYRRWTGSQKAIRAVDVSQVVEPKSRVMNASASVLNLCELCAGPAGEAAGGSGRQHSCPYCRGMQCTSM